jgi:iron complex outermembrane recepter protein
VEAGVKQVFFNQRAEWTLAVYDITRSNVYAAQGGRALALAGQQASQGVELSAALRPTAAWRTWGNLAVNRTRYENYNFDGGSYSGNAPPNAPRVVANAGVAYRWAGSWPVELSTSLRHVGERFHSDANTARLSSYTVADAALSVDLAAETRVTLRVRNLTNKTYAAWSDPFYPDQILLGAQRSVELALNAKF